MKKKIKLILLFLILGLGAYYFYNKAEELQKLKDLSVLQICIASLAILFSQCLGALKFKKLFNAFKVTLTVHEWFGLPQVRKLGNLLFFKSGTVTNAYYLKTHYRFSYTKFVLALSIQKFLELYALVLMWSIFSLCLYYFRNLSFNYFLFFLLFLSGISFLLLVPPWKMPKWESRFYKNIQKILDKWYDFKDDKFSVFIIIFLEILLILAIGTRLFIAFHILGHPVDLFDCILMSIVVSITGIVGIIPGQIGVREVAVGLSASYMDHGFDFGVIATTLDRIFSTAWYGLLGFIYFHVLHIKKYAKDTGIISDTAFNNT